MPRMVVLDGHTLNPGDLDWSELAALGDLTVHPRTAPPDVAERAEGATILLTNKTALPRDTLAHLPALRFISVLATGVNVVDLAAARERGVMVSNVPAYSTASVAQMTFALLLELTQHVGLHAASVAAGDWCRSPDFAYWRAPLVELEGRVLGVVGYGAIGRAVAGIARAFGMSVLVHTRTPPAAWPEGVAPAAWDEILQRADVVSLHCPLTEQTRGLVNAHALARMKRDAFLINTGRGPLVDERALADALNADRLAGAATDVLSVEPPPPDNPLLHARNCLITPHCAWATRAARRRLLSATVANVRAFLAGRPIHVVN